MGIEVKVPDIGDFADIPVIEIFVKEGDTIGPDDPLISLESDKATMDVPSPQGGVVETILIKIGDKVSEGAPILLLKGEAAADSAPNANGAASADTAALA
ncbi:biotin/lipoyl-containing protein, partial [Methylobacterium trifolii]